MDYRFEKEHINYEAFASGRVLYNRQGSTSFPVRLASEIFQRCLDYLSRTGLTGPYSLYDPCCGGGYLLTVLGLLHPDKIKYIIASDINEDSLTHAQRNLSLLTVEGINRRICELTELATLYGKASHRDALESAEQLRSQVEDRSNCPDIYCYKADILHCECIDKLPKRPDIIITDLPYGNLVSWETNSSNTDDNETVIRTFLTNLAAIAIKPSVAAIVSDKKQTIKHEAFARVEQFKVGRRKVTLLEPV